MQPEAQTTTRGSLAVSAGALEIAIVIQSTLCSDFTSFTFSNKSAQESSFAFAIGLCFFLK